MNAPNEKDYLDSKLQTAIERLNGDARAREIATDARLEKIDHGLQSVRRELDARITQAESNFQRSVDCTGEELSRSIKQTEKNFEHGLQSIREEFNAKLTLMETNVQHALHLNKEEFNSRFNQLEANFQRDLQAIRVEFNEKLSKLETSIHRSIMDAVKWMIGTMMALTVISITVSSTLFLRVASKEQAPVKAPPTAASSPRSGPTERDGKTSPSSLALVAQSPKPAAIHPTTAVTRTAR